MQKATIILFLLVNGVADLHATNWLVGPTRPFTVPSAVANLVADGDTVSIDAGIYTGDVAKWFAHHLLLRSVGSGYAHLEAAGNNAEGKAIWVIKGNDCVVEGIEFSGCQVPDVNGAGIRQEGKNLTLRRCYFHNNEMGILTSNDGVSDYLFEFCEFAENGYGDGYSHNIYVGHANSLTLRFCYSHDAHVGHLVKSRAKYNYLYYNRLTGENGDGSYEVDLPNGGEAILVGNLIEQSANSQNGGIVSFGLEGATNPSQVIALCNNTLINNRFDGRFVQCNDQTALVKMVNNLILGPGQLLQGGSTASLDTTHNLRHLNIADAALVDPSNFDYHPTDSSACVDTGTTPVLLGSDTILTPLFQYLHPMGMEIRETNGTSIDIGAYEYDPPVTGVANLAKETGLSVFPNPITGNTVSVRFDKPLEREAQLRVIGVNSEVILEQTIKRGEQNIVLSFQEALLGIYLLDIAGFDKLLLVSLGK